MLRALATRGSFCQRNTDWFRRIRYWLPITLNTMRKAERNAWAKRVKAQMETRLPAADRIVVLAGQRYSESLMDYLRQRARTVEIPMEGLTIGRQLQYLTGGLHHDRL